MWNLDDDGGDPPMTRFSDALKALYVCEITGNNEASAHIDAEKDEKELIDLRKMIQQIKIESVTGMKANFADPMLPLDKIVQQITDEENEEEFGKLKIAYCHLMEEKDQLEKILRVEKRKSEEYLSIMDEFKRETECLKKSQNQLKEFYKEKLLNSKNQATISQPIELKEQYFSLNFANAKLIEKNEQLNEELEEANRKIHDSENKKYHYRYNLNKVNRQNDPDISVPPPNMNPTNQEAILPCFESPSIIARPGAKKSKFSFCPSLDSPIPDIDVPVLSPVILRWDLKHPPNDQRLEPVKCAQYSENTKITSLMFATKSTQTDVQSNILKNEELVEAINAPTDDKFADKSDINDKSASAFEKDASSDFMTKFIHNLDTPPFIQKLLQEYATPPESPNFISGNAIKSLPMVDREFTHCKCEEDLLINQLQEMGFSPWSVVLGVKMCGVDMDKMIHYCLVLSMLVDEGNSLEDVEQVVKHYNYEQLETSENVCRWHLASLKRMRKLGFSDQDIHEALIQNPEDYKAALEHLIKSPV